MESPEIYTPDQSKNYSDKNLKEELSPEAYAIKIEYELMKHLLLNSSSNEEALEWAKEHSEEYRKIFNTNQEQFIKMYKEDPESLYVLLGKYFLEDKTLH